MPQLAFQRSSEARRRPGIATLAFATLAAILLGLAILSHAGSGANDREVRREQARVLEAVTLEREATSRELAALRADDPAAHVPLDGASADPGELNNVLELSRDAPGSVRVLAGRPIEGTDLAGQVADLVRPILQGGAEQTSGMIEAGGELYDAVGIAGSRSGAGEVSSAPRTALIGLRKVDSDYLGALARSSGAEGLKLARMASGQAGQNAEDGSVLPADWAGFGVTWHPDRPGDRLVIQWTVALVALAALMAVVLIVRAKRVTGELYASEARAVEASNCDWLSGLPNRVYFNHVLERELKRGTGTLALLYLDLDRFRDINDTFGIELGDRVIQIATERIADVLRDGDLMARFEGDAFLILQLDVQGPHDCELLAERILNAMKHPFEIDGARITATVSIGVALAPRDAGERTELVRLANLALYRAKREGRNRLVFYKPDMEDEWRRRNATELQLRQAIDHGGLVLRYQPIINCETGQAVCAEALVRWHHPTEGLIAPDHFIGLAEDRGLILPLGEWVMREACNEAKHWPGVRVAVNVSPIQFRHREFVRTVFRVLSETGLEPSRLELELTEGVLVENAEDAVAAINALRDRGVRLALDDFGTGYSSLIYLRRFAFDKIKIDKAFIETLEPVGEGAILVESVVSLGRALGLTVTAEGIETAEQKSFLTALGCHEIQGYLISQPLTGPEVRAFLASNASSEQPQEITPLRAIA